MIELGLHRYLIKSGMTKKVFFTKEGIKYLPEKMLYGLPLDKRELLLSDLFTLKEKLSILYNMYNTLEDEDIKELTVEEFFRAIVNEKIYVKLIEPLLTSYYAIYYYSFACTMELAELLLNNCMILLLNH